MKGSPACKPRFTFICLALIVALLATFELPVLSTSQCPPRIMPSRTTRATDATRRRQEDEAMAAATLQKEKEARLKKDGSHDDIVNSNPRPSMVSPPAAPNLNSLLTGHTGQDVEKPAEETGTATEEDQADDNVKSPKKKKVKKSKAAKDDKPAKRDRSCSSLKQSSFATLQVATASSAKDYKFE